LFFSDSDSIIALIVGASAGGVIFLIITIVCIVFCFKKSTRSRSDNESSHETQYPFQEGQHAVAGEVHRTLPVDRTDVDQNISSLIYGKIGESARDRPKHTRGRAESDYADVRVDREGYPAFGAVPTCNKNGCVERH